MGPSELNRVCILIRDGYRIAVEIGEPSVIYLETIRRHSVAEGKYIRQTGGLGNYGHVKIQMEPTEEGKGIEFTNRVQDGQIPTRYIPSIESGIREALQGGVLAGYKIVDTKVTLFDGSYHSEDSNEMAFRIAASMAFKDAARKANPVILEPVMAVEVLVPAKYVDAVIDDLSRRRGRIESIDAETLAQTIRAKAPLAEMLYYSAQLDALTDGWGQGTMEFVRYEVASRPDQADGDEAGVTAKRPSGPKPPRDAATASLDPEFE